MQSGDPAPGGGTVMPFRHVTNDGGTIAYQTQVSDSTATQGIFRTDETGTVAIARDAVAAPTGGIFTSLGEPVINDRGQVAFEAEMSGGTANFGIFRDDGGDVVPVFVANELAPGRGTFTDFGDPAINAHDQVAVVGLLTDSASGSGIFLGDGTDAVAIALGGQPAPKGGRYTPLDAFRAPLMLNDRGKPPSTRY